MTLIAEPLRTVTEYGFELLFRTRKVLVALIMIGLGIGFGYAISSSEEAGWVLLSILAIVIMVFIILNKPVMGLIVLVGVFPFVELTINVPMGAGIPDLSFSRFTIAFLAITMLAQAAIGNFRFATPLISIVEVCIIGTLIGVGISARLSPNPIGALEILISRLLEPMLLFFFARHLVRNKTDLNRLFWAIVLLGFASAIYAIYESATGHILLYEGDTPLEKLATSNPYGENLWLLRGLLGTSPTFGRVFGFTIPIAFYLFFEHKSTLAKFLLGVMIVIIFYGLFITYNRTSWYAAIISLTILQFFYTQFRPIYFVIVIVAVVGLWATWDQVNQSEVVEARVNDKTETFNGRTQIWDTAEIMWQEKPVWGWGYGVFQKVSGRYRVDGLSRDFSSPQSEYWNILLTSGLVGAVPYFALL